MAIQLRVVTLNCWGLWCISKDRKERIGYLGDELARGRYDIVTLQEVWMERDYRSICDKVKAALPYHHYFHSGLLGSGMCLLSKWPILDTMIHAYSLNSYAYRILEGDWFAGKAVGLAVIQVEDLTVNVYTTHITALYAPSNNISADEHFTHRLLQSYELSEFVRLTGTTSDLNLVSGDFNTEDYSLGLKVIRANADLKDAWLERPDPCKDQRCCTVEAPDNCYTHVKASYYVGDTGMRIDYILYGTKTSCRVTCRECSLSFEKIPGTAIHYSDHCGVEALLELGPRCDQGDAPTASHDEEDRLSALREILPYVDNSIQATKRQRLSYLLKSLLVFVLLASLWLSGLLQWCSGGICARLASLLVFVALVVSGVAALCIGGAVKTTELNQLIGRKRDVVLQVRRLETSPRLS